MVTNEQIKKQADKIHEQMKRFSLYDYEGMSGHTLACHCNVPESTLKNDCRFTYTGSNKKRDVATSFYSEEQAEEIIVGMITKATMAIAAWLLNDSKGKPLILRKKFNSQVGYGYSSQAWHEWKNGAFKCNCVIVTLVKRYYRSGEPYFIIITAYPCFEKDV